MLEFIFDTQLLIEGCQTDEDFAGVCLLVAGAEEAMKLHFHTNEPWKVLEYCASLGELYDIVVENMERQEQGLKG